MANKPAKVIDLTDLFQAKPQINHEVPEDHDEYSVSLAELRQLEQSMVQAPGARWTTAQRVFFEALLASPTMDAKDAARKAGVKPGQAKRWLSNPDTQAALNHLMTQRVQRVGISPDKMLREMYNCFQMARGEKPILKTYQHEGVLYTDEVRHTDLAAAARFADMLAKHFRLYQDATDATPPVSIHLDLTGEAARSVIEHE